MKAARKSVFAHEMAKLDFFSENALLLQNIGPVRSDPCLFNGEMATGKGESMEIEQGREFDFNYNSVCSSADVCREVAVSMLMCYAGRKDE